MTATRSTLALLLLVVGAATAQTPVPEFGGLVTDGADILDETAEADVLAACEATLRATDGPLVAVLTVASRSDQESIAAFAERVALAWDVAPDWRDRGVLVVADMQNRELRIQVADALGDRISDSEARDVMDRVLAPAFGSERYERGLLESIRALDDMARVASDREARSWSVPARRRRTGSIERVVVVGILAVVAGLFAVARSGSSRKRMSRRQRRRQRRLARHFSGWGASGHQAGFYHHHTGGSFGGGGFSGGGGGGGFSGGASGSF